jgi:hypothetical protein
LWVQWAFGDQQRVQSFILNTGKLTPLIDFCLDHHYHLPLHGRRTVGSRASLPGRRNHTSRTSCSPSGYAPERARIVNPPSSCLPRLEARAPTWRRSRCLHGASSSWSPTSRQIGDKHHWIRHELLFDVQVRILSSIHCHVAVTKETQVVLRPVSPVSSAFLLVNVTGRIPGWTHIRRVKKSRPSRLH